jgi:outer membrane protein insertion porin family/translocation and assembly module TamA
LLLVLTLAAAACNEEGSIKVHKIAFKGVAHVDQSRLKGALATRESSILPWGKKNYFDRSRFDADLKRISAFYADRGFPDARVTGFDVKMNAKQTAVDVTVTIDEGAPVKVAAVTFVGFDVIPPQHLAAMQKQVPLKTGQPRDRQVVVATHELALNELRDHGFPYAKVATDEDDGTDGKSATMTFTAQPGILAHFGPVEIAGNKSVSDNVIRRELAFKPGDLYQRSLVQETQRRLYSMELFQFATVSPQDQEQQAPTVPTRVTVAEGNHQRVNFGVGYGTEEKARVDAEYHHLNFLGGARSAGVHARWSSLDRGVRLDFTQPYLFRPNVSLGLEGQQWYTVTPAYTSTTSGGKTTLGYKPSKQTSWSLSVTSERDSSTISPDALIRPELRNSLIALGLDPRTNQQSGTLNAAGIDFNHSTADNALNAHHGYQIALHTEQAGKLLPGTFNYFAVSADARHYLPLGNNVVVASRLQLGNIAPPGNDQTRLPFSKRYFLGGATSVRGWGRYEVGPLSDGLPIGGDSLFAFSEEVRASLRGNLGGVLFLDAGNVWADSWGIKLNDLKYAVGPGLRYDTPIGPIRLDFGWQLNPIDGLLVNGSPQTRRWRIHFSIGQAF